MAGLSNRFKQAGFKKPKYMLNAGDKTLFEHSISGFSSYFETEPFLFVYLKDQVDPAFILNKCRRQGLKQENIILSGLDHPTDGQATTVSNGLSNINVSKAEPLTIFNIDTIYRSFKHPDFSRFPESIGYLDVFKAEGDHWSFVKPIDPDAKFGRALEVAEKKRISNLCSTGLYHFRSAGLFLDEFATIADYSSSSLQGAERYIAPLYNNLIKRGEAVYYRTLNAKSIQFSGTPSEYKDFTKNNAWGAETP